MNRPVCLDARGYLLAHLWQLFFSIFAALHIGFVVIILHKNIFNAMNFNPYKKPSPLLNMVTCTQNMQRTWWPVTYVIRVWLVSAGCTKKEMSSFWWFLFSLTAEIVKMTSSSGTNDEKFKMPFLLQCGGDLTQGIFNFFLSNTL